MRKNTDMTSGSPFKLLLFFTLPIICNYALQQFYSLADSMIVAAALGNEAVTGVNLTGSLNFLVLGFASGCTAGFGMCMAQFVGAKDEEKMRKSLFTSVCLTVIISVVLTSFTVIFSRNILILLETNELYLDYSDSYIKTIFSGIIFTMFYNLSSQFLFAMGDSRSPMYILLVCAILNVGLNSLMFVFELGVAWAGWATVISQGVAAIVGFIVLFKKYPVLRLGKADASFSWRFAAKHLATSLPMALQFSITAIGCMIQQRAFNRFPPEYAMGQTAGNKVSSIVEGGIFNAFGAAVATYFGQNYGAKRVDRLRQGVFACLAVGGILMLVAMGVVFLLFPILMPILLPSASQEVYGLAFVYLSITASMYVFLILLQIFRNALQGIGKSGMSTFGGVMELVARTVCAYTLANLSFECACFSNPMAWASAGIFFATVFFIYLKKMQKAKLNEPLT